MSNPPVAKFRIGVITATIWQNESHYNTVLSKAFKDQQSGEWRDTDQLSHHDLLNAAKVLTSAQAWISDQQ